MAKRFTDTGKWNKKFIRSLSKDYKLLWLFITDECDTAGIWDVDIDVARIKAGIEVNEEDALLFFNGKVVAIDGGSKWFIPSFIEFQYGELSEGNRAHTKAILQLKKFNLLSKNLKIKPLTSPLQGATQGGKAEEEDKVEEEVVLVGGEFENFNKWVSAHAPRVLEMEAPITESEYFSLVAEFPIDVIKEILSAMHNHKKLTKDNVSANLTFRNWARRRGVNPASHLPTHKPSVAV